MIQPSAISHWSALQHHGLTEQIPQIATASTHYDRKSLSKRLGWALEYFGVSSKELEPLLKVPIEYYCRLDPSTPPIGPRDKHWMIQNNLTKEKNK